MNSYAETGGGFNSNHGQTTRPAEAQKHQNISSTWSYNGQLEGMYFGGEHQPMFVGPYDGTKHANYPQYPAGTLHQPVPTPVVKCNEACCQHFQDRYPLNPAPLRYQPGGPVQPRYADLPNPDTRQYFTDRRAMPSLSRKKVYAENGYPGISDRRFPQYVGRGQLHLDSRQQMQMMRAQYPMYPPYWGSARGWTGPRMNCPPPPSYHQSINQGAQLKMADGSHYIDPTTQKSFSTQHRRAVGTGGGTDIIRPVPDPKRTTLDPNSQSCYEFGYPTGFVPFSEVNKIQGGNLTSQGNASCKIPNEKQYHPHQMQYAMQSGDRSLMNCGNPINDLSYSMNFPLPGNDSYMRSGLEDGQSIADSRKMQYDSLSKKRPDLDLRQYLATWEDDEDESTRLPEALALGNNGAPYIVVDCRSLEGDAASKLQERFKTTQASSTKSRSSSPNSDQKQSDEQSRRNESSERTEGQPDFQNQTSYAPPSMPALLNETDKSLWNSLNRDNEGVIGKGAFQPLDCSKRDSNQDAKRDSHPHSDLPVQKIPGTNDNSNMTLDALVSYYGDNRRVVDGGYDFVEMTERLVNNIDKTPLNNRSHMDHSLSSEVSRPCDPRLHQSQLGNNPSMYNKVSSRYPTTSYQHYKPGMHTDPYYNYKHPISSNKYFGYDNSQILDPNYDYHKIASEFDNSRLYGNKDVSKDPRRMFHQEIDKNVESTFYDPIRKPQLADCFQDKANLEFASVDPEQFINPAAIKKSLDPREKLYSDKNHVIRDRVDALNNTNQNQSEKTVLITSQNGPPEIFRVPFSPDIDMSHKDNVVTLHAGDQNKSSTMTVEVPYVQQYSTLVKLSEEISRAEKNEVESTKCSDTVPSKMSSGDEFKKPTSFKLKRVPNSKEWTVEGKELGGSTSTTDIADCESATPTSASYEIKTNDLKQSEAVSSLNMPSLDDIRDGEEDRNNIEEHQSKNKPNDGVLSSSKICSTMDETNKTKYNLQTPQMAIVQPMKMNQSNNEASNATCASRSKLLDGPSEKTIGKGDSNLTNSKEVELNTDNDISKHGNFRAHKKIQSGFTNSLPNCVVSSNDDFLHSQDLNTSESKETYSPFPVFPECDVNSQLSDYFKIDERNSGEKILDSSSRVPSSPGVDAMFEDINNSNQNQLYPTKSCNFHDLTDPNNSLTNHNAHFQSFSSIFSDESDKVGRPDGSVLQMNDKKYLKNIFDDIGHHDQEDKLLETRNLNEVDSTKSDETKKSPPIPTISLKLNETKKMWCIANKDDSSVSDDSTERMYIESPKTTINHCQDNLTADTVCGLEGDLAQALQEESTKSFSKKYKTLEVPSALLDLNENEQNTCCESQNESDLNQLICEEIDKHNSDSLSNILEIDYRRNYSLVLEETSHFVKENLNQLQSANKCRSLIKYSPRNKVCKQNSLKCTDKYKTLIFDENGKDFTHQSYLEVAYIDDAYSFVQDLLYNLISKSIDTYERKNKAADALFDFNEPSNVKINDECAGLEKANIPTVIKFDSSGHQNEAYKIQGSNLNMAKILIQHEKETCNNSVIKVVQSENFNDKKIIRSIFSPQSEDGDSEDVIKSKDIVNSFEIDAEGSNSAVCLLNNKQALDLSYKRKYADDSHCDKVKNGQINQNLTSIGSRNEEGLKEFCSPKITPLIPQSFHNRTKDNLEIDEALELMGLATSKPIDIETKNDDNVEASLCEELVDEGLDLLHDSLESEDDLHLSLDEKRKNKIMEIKVIEPESCPEIVQVVEATISEKASDNVCTNKLTREVSISESDCSSLSSNKITSLCLFRKSDEHNIEKGSQPELCSSITESSDKRDQSISQSSTMSDLDISANKTDDEMYHPSSVNVICGNELTTQEHIKRKCSGENIGKEMPPRKLIKTFDIESEKNCCNEWENFNANTEHEMEDVESRLEMSVIVRNKSCSSRVYKDENTGLLNEIDSEENYNLLQNGLEPECKNVITSVDSCTQILKDNDLSVDQESNKNPLYPRPSSHTEMTSSSVYLDPCTDSTKTENAIQTAESKEINSSSNFKSSYNTTCRESVVAKPTYEIERLSVEHPYCSGESIFLSIDETSSYLEISRLSYFHEFKRRKWQRYWISSNGEHCAHTTNNNVMLNHCHVENVQSSKANANAPAPSDYNQEGSYDIVPSPDNNQKEIVKLAGNENVTSFESQKMLIEKGPSLICKEKQGFCVRRDSLKILEPEAVLKEIFSPDSAFDDSESKENECPTDAQLQKKHFIDVESLSYTNQASIIQYNSAILENKLKDASSLLHPDKSGTLSGPFGKSNSELFSKCKKQDTSTSIQLERGNPDLGPNTFKNQIGTPNEESGSLNKDSSDTVDVSTFRSQIFEEKSKDISDQDSTMSMNYTTESKEAHKSVIYCGPDFNCDPLECTTPTDGVVKDFHMTSNTPISMIQFKSLDSPNCSDLVKTQQLFITSNLKPSHDLHKNTGAVELLSCESSERVNNIKIANLGGQGANISSFTKEYSNSTSTDYNKVENTTTNNDKNILATLDLVENESGPKDNTECTVNTDGNSIGILGINNVMPSDSPCLSLEMKKGAIKAIDSISSSNEVRANLEQNQSPDHCPVSKCCDLNFSNDSDPNSDKNEGIQRLTINYELNEEMCYESEENGANIDENHVIENKLSSSEGNKVTEDHNILKINSVQDSLIHNHNLNKENPLQCLVEAALALENVESSILNNNIERTSKSETSTDVENNQKSNNDVNCQEGNNLTPADKEIFSKFEETNYNLRASTRIVTSSSSNIIPYPKRKYTLKSSKFSSGKLENKAKISDQPGMEKCRSKKRKCGFTYPRSKRRKKVTKSKADLQSGDLERIEGGNVDAHAIDCELSKYDTMSVSKNICDATQAVENVSKDHQIIVPLEKSEDLNSNFRSCLTSNSDNDFGGPLIIANSPNSNEGNVLCVQVNSNKMDEYVNNINVGGFEVMSESQSLFKESSVGVDSSSDQTLENSTSLVIIFDNLGDDSSNKVNLEERKKEESDIILGSMNTTSSVLRLPQSDSTLDDCAELLTPEFSVNESCICPPELKMTVDPDRTKPKSNPYKSIESDTLSKSSYDVESNYSKYSIPENQEILTASCYEELHENLVNDIGNWPFVEEEVAEFNEKNELPNNIPEEGRKIELKCSLPWKKIFNISRKKKSKESKKVSGLELGPAKVEVRLRAPSSEWKVISDFYDNASPVVKVKRLILQRDSDLSSFSEKDSEEENEQKRKVLSNNTSDRISSVESNTIESNMIVTNEILTNVTVDEHWQPVVVLNRIPNLDEINLTLDKEIPSQDPSSPCSISQSTFSCDEKSSPNISLSENEASDDISICSHCSSGSEAASEQSELCATTDKTEDTGKDDSSMKENPAKVQAYETYSPSDCNNSFTGEKLYSPSDPHFSPESRSKGFENYSSSESINYNDLSSDEEDQSVKQTSSKYLMDVIIQKEPVALEATFLQEQGSLESKNNYNHSEGVEVGIDLQQKEDNGIIEPHNHSELETSTLVPNIPQSPNPTETLNCLSSGSSALIDSEIPNTNVAEPFIYLENAGTSHCKGNSESSKEASETSVDIKKHIKRKMPNNFFVRRRLKKHIQSPYKTLHLVEGNTGSSVRPFTFSSTCDPTLDPPIIINQRDPTSSGNNEHKSNSESDISIVGGISRLQSAYDLEVSSPVGHNESPSVERFEVKQRLRDGGRGLKRPSEGHSKGDTKRRRKKLKNNSNRCRECNIQFEKKEELARHNAYRHARRRELHHCLLCQRSFSSAVRHSLHVQGRSHRHLELTQRHTMHAMHHLLVGGEFPLIPPLSRTELRTLQWRPAQQGYAHFYHQLTPLQAALQEHNTDVSEDTLSEDRMPND